MGLGWACGCLTLVRGLFHALLLSVLSTTVTFRGVPWFCRTLCSRRMGGGNAATVLAHSSFAGRASEVVPSDATTVPLPARTP